MGGLHLRGKLLSALEVRAGYATFWSICNREEEKVLSEFPDNTEENLLNKEKRRGWGFVRHS
jgi:hypothetical protein